MLESTFIHCPGVGAATERRLWRAGFARWSDVAGATGPLPVARATGATLSTLAEQSIWRLESQDYRWFARQLPGREQWRALRPFRERIAFLDIETTGGPEGGDVTVIGLYNGRTLRQFVHGFDLEEFPAALADTAMLVTFFGSGFDLPVLRRRFGLTFPQLHVDLCFLLKRLGYTGGLKQVESRFGIVRDEQTRGLSGWDAVKLWNRWTRGDRKALDSLLAYNAEDVVNLERLLSAGYGEMERLTLEGIQPAS